MTLKDRFTANSIQVQRRPSKEHSRFNYSDLVNFQGKPRASRAISLMFSPHLSPSSVESSLDNVSKSRDRLPMVLI